VLELEHVCRTLSADWVKSTSRCEAARFSFRASVSFSPEIYGGATRLRIRLEPTTRPQGGVHLVPCESAQHFWVRDYGGLAAERQHDILAKGADQRPEQSSRTGHANASGSPEYQRSPPPTPTSRHAQVHFRAQHPHRPFRGSRPTAHCAPVVLAGGAAPYLVRVCPLAGNWKCSGITSCSARFTSGNHRRAVSCRAAHDQDSLSDIVSRTSQTGFP
jgi:hypothetical protein